MLSRLKQGATRRFAIDTRSLAAFRIALGLLVVADVLLRLRNFEFFYTDSGAVPVSLGRELTPDYAFSVFFLSGSPSVAFALFIAHLLVGIALIVGYHTRVVAVLAFVFVISLDVRNPLVTSYADTLFRYLIFWAMFLPLGKRFSLDAIRSTERPPETVTRLAGAFVLLQMIAMYVANGSHKIPRRDEWFDGTALYGTLHYDSVSWLLGPHIREIEPLMLVGSAMWYTLMLGAPMLLLFAGRARYFAAAMYAGGHGFMALTVRIGAFPYVAMAGLVLFCQPRAWGDLRWVAAQLGVLERIDGAVRTVAEYGTRVDRRLPRATLPERPGVERLRVPATVLVMFIVITSGVFMITPILGTVGAMDEETTVPLESEVQSVQANFRLDQPPWRFYQGAMRSDEYYVFVGSTADGETVDVYNDRPMAWDRPHGHYNYKQLDTYRERFYMASIEAWADPDYSDGPENRYAAYLCETYRGGGAELTGLNMYVIEERVDLENASDYESYDREATLIHAHGCGDNEPRDIELPPAAYTPTLDDDAREAIEREDDRRYIDEVRPDPIPAAHVSTPAEATPRVGPPT